MKKVFIILIVIIALMGSAWFYWNDQKAPKATFKEVTNIWTHVLSDIHDNWSEGVDLNDPVLLDNCPEFNNLKIRPAKELISCRSLPFKCFYKNRKNKVTINKEVTPFTVNFPEETSQEWSVAFDLVIEKEKKRFYLDDKCLTADIPDQVYNHGKYISQKNFWRPGDVKYWVDKYLVRNIDVIYWSRQRKKEIKMNSKGLFAPATFNNSKDMKNFCSYRRSVVMNSMLADAVTYYGVDDKSAMIMNKNQSPYPFSVRKKNVGHAKMLKNPEYKITKEDCQKIYSRECIELNYKNSPAESLGWSGVGELLGGPMEFVINHLNPRRNIMLSSQYFPLTSNVHKAAQRGHWSETAVFENDFSFLVESPRHEGEYDVAFRCMGVIH
jgi:hypothetical protein